MKKLLLLLLFSPCAYAGILTGPNTTSSGGGGSVTNGTTNTVYVTTSAQLYNWDGNTNHLSTGAVLQPNTLVYVTPGTYYVPALPLAQGVQLIGIGFPSIYHTNAVGANECDLLTMGPFLQPNHNCSIIGLNIVATNGLPALGYYDAPIGQVDQEIPFSLTNAGFNCNTNATNVYVANCTFTGMSDAMYFYFQSQNTTNIILFDNCTFNSQWDTGYLKIFSTNSIMNIYRRNCTFNPIANTNITGNGWQGQARGTVLDHKGVFLSDLNCTYNIWGTNITSVYALGAVGAGIGPQATIVGDRINFPLGTNAATQPTTVFSPSVLNGNFFGSYYDINNNLNLIGTNFNISAMATVANPLADMVTPYTNGQYRGALSVTVSLTDSAVTGSPGALLTNLNTLQGIPITNSFVLSGTQYYTVSMRVNPQDVVYVTNLSSGSASAALIRSFLTKE